MSNEDFTPDFYFTPELANRIDRDSRPKAIANPVVGLGFPTGFFVRWWDHKGAHREAFDTRLEALTFASRLADLPTAKPSKKVRGRA